MPTEPTALFVIRAWRESDSPTPLRAEIRLTRDVSAGFQQTFAVAETDTVLEAVRDWLTEILAENVA